MSGLNIKPKLRLSPNEITESIKNEEKKWRIFRLQQVREQARNEAARVRREVKNEKTKNVNDLRNILHQQWLEDKENRLHQMKEEYITCLNAIGEAHEEANLQPDVVDVITQQRQLNNWRAAERGHKAQIHAAKMKEEEEKKQMSKLHPKQKALHNEKLRSRKVASLPTPAALIKNVVVKKAESRVMLHDARTFTTTLYKPIVTPVRKETQPGPDARSSAQERMDQLMKDKEENKIGEEAIKQRTQTRCDEALQKEHRKIRYKKLLEQLEKAQRQHQLSAFLQGADNSIESAAKVIRPPCDNSEAAEAAVEELLQESDFSTHAPSSTPSTPSMEGISELKDVDEEYIDKSNIDCRIDNEIRHPDLCDKNRRDLQHLKEQRITNLNERYHRNDDKRFDEIRTPLDFRDMEFERNISREIHCPIEEDERDVDRDIQDERDVDRDIQDKRDVDRDIQDERDVDRDIHFAATVPIHEIYNKHNKEPSIVDIHQDYSSSCDEVLVRIQVGDDIQTDDYDQEVSSQEMLFNKDISKKDYSHNTHYLSPPHPTESPLYHEVTNNNLPEGYSSTSYYSPPTYIPDQVWENIRKIQENKRNIKLMLQDMNEGEAKCIDNQQKISSTLSNKQQSHLYPKTPPRIYTKELKSEGTGQRPLKKKEKFEKLKHEVLQTYIKKLVAMKKEEMDNISASTIEGSGLTISSLSLLASTIKSYKPIITDSTEPSNELSTESSYCYVNEPPTRIPRKTDCFLTKDQFRSILPENEQIISPTLPSSDHPSISVTLPSILSSSSSTIDSSMATTTTSDSSLSTQQLSSLSNNQLEQLSSLSKTQLEDYLKSKKIELYNNLIQLQAKKQTILREQQQQQQQQHEQYNVDNYHNNDVVNIEQHNNDDIQVPERDGSAKIPVKLLSELALTNNTNLSLRRDAIYSSSIDNSSVSNSIQPSLNEDMSDVNYSSQDCYPTNDTSHITTSNITSYRSSHSTSHQDIIINEKTSAGTIKHLTEGNNLVSKPHDSVRLHNNNQIYEKHFRGQINSNQLTNNGTSIPNNHPAEDYSNQGSSSSRPSSPSSFPDMELVLSRFGWAQSMVRKMDKAEENTSSSS